MYKSLTGLFIFLEYIPRSEIVTENGLTAQPKGARFVENKVCLCAGNCPGSINILDLSDKSNNGKNVNH